MDIRMAGQQASEINQVEEMIEWLASYGKTKNGGVTRLLYTPSWRDAQDALFEKMGQLGFEPYFDSVGNLFGRLEGTERKDKAILTGSHIDTVIEGGKYDGAYGIIASLIAASKLFELYGNPKKTIEIVSFCEEEGSRFPLTFWGSRNVSGVYNLEQVQGVKDQEGVLFLDAMREAGFAPEKYVSPLRKDVERFIEIHIEQGVVLERNNCAIGIVSHIVGQRRYNVRITGESNHAGTTPMKYRKDAVSAASKLISAITDIAHEIDTNLVATVGKVNVLPNVPNVVAGEVIFSLDIRHHEEELLDRYCYEVFEVFREAGENLNMKIEVAQWMDVKPVKMDVHTNNCLREIVSRQNFSYQDIVSGAGHDAQVFAPTVPTSLIFVPSHNGVSHSPQEFTDVADLEKGIEILTEFLYKFAY